MNVASEFKTLIDNFCAGLKCIQQHSDGGCVSVNVEDGDLIWIAMPPSSGPMEQKDAKKLRKRGFEFSDPDNGEDYGSWSFRLMIPTTPCPDRIKTEREIESLHAMY